jgi:hypothetical protein
VPEDLPAIRDVGRLAPRSPAPPARSGPAPPAGPAGPRLGRRVLGAALLCATLGLGSCHALLLAAFG